MFYMLECEFIKIVFKSTVRGIPVFKLTFHYQIFVLCLNKTTLYTFNDFEF